MGEDQDAAGGVVIVPSPGMGHLIPAIELASRLATRHHLHVTLVLVPGSHAASAASSSLVRSSSAAATGGLHHVHLPLVDVSDLVRDNDKVLTRIRVTMHESIPALKSTLASLSHKVSAMIVDFLGGELLGVAPELGIPKRYVFAPSSAWCLALMVSLPQLDRTVEGEFTDLEEPVQVPGCRPVGSDDLLDSMMDRTDQQYRDAVRRGVEIAMADGVLLNVWEDLEPVTLASFRDGGLLGRVMGGPVYPIGPLTRQSDRTSSCEDLFRWLDCQPGESVVYVCFGSGGTLSSEQMVEVAWGLELSRQRFIWVVREPTLKTGDGSYFTPANGNGIKSLSSYLPDGFEARTEDIGLLVTQWAPQAEILRHPSVGAFMSHCGWNSTLESITNGVPMIAWPIHAEQRLNATLLSEELGVAVRPKTLPSKGVVGREEIKTMIQSVLVDGEQGKVIKARAKKLKSSAERALNDGGSSDNALVQFVKECQLTVQRSDLETRHCTG